jgi:hypothetical protein
VSCLQILFGDQTFDLTCSLFFSSATSYYPGRGNGNDYSSHPADSYHLTDSNDGDTDIELEEDWLAEPQGEEPAMRMSTKASEAIVVEVCFLLSSFS